jgi:hypothetical protein
MVARFIFPLYHHMVKVVIMVNEGSMFLRKPSSLDQLSHKVGFDRRVHDITSIPVGDRQPPRIM